MAWLLSVFTSDVGGGIYCLVSMHKSVMLMGGITSREEARVVLECISPTLVRGVVAIAVADVKTSRDLANALNMSLRNAQRVIRSLESIKAVKVVRYGKKKIIVSLNKYFEKEVLEFLKKIREKLKEIPELTQHGIEV